MKKKAFLILFLGILLIGLVAIVYANGQGNQTNGNGNSNETNGNATDGNGNQTDQNQTIYCEEQPCSNCICREGIRKVKPCVPPVRGGCAAVVCYECDTNLSRWRTNITFIPWQKRNESECLEGCKCVGAVVSCPTETGKIMNITAGRSGNIITIIIDKTETNTTFELEQEHNKTSNKTRLHTRLSNGRKAEIKIMPYTASETAIERLRLKVCSPENNCTIELKEVGKGNETQAAYEIQAERHARILAIFKTKMQVKAQVSAENGEIIRVKKPWWAFLASESKER